MLHDIRIKNAQNMQMHIVDFIQLIYIKNMQTANQFLKFVLTGFS